MKEVKEECIVHIVHRRPIEYRLNVIVWSWTNNAVGLICLTNTCDWDKWIFVFASSHCYVNYSWNHSSKPVSFLDLTTQKDDPSITLFRILHRGTCNNDILDDSRREGRVPFLMVVQITDTVKSLYSGRLWDHWKVSTIQRCLYKEVLLYI